MISIFWHGGGSDGRTTVERLTVDQAVNLLAAQLELPVDESATIAIVRFQNDSEFLDLDRELGKRAVERLQAAALASIRPSIDAWSGSQTFVDGPGWRVLYNRTRLEGRPAARGGR